MSGRLAFLPLLLLLTSCAAVPLNGNSQEEKPRPVKPLPWKGQLRVAPTQDPAAKGFKVADPTTASPKASAPKAAKKAAVKVDNAAIAAKLTEAEDKASSARSMAQSAQTQDDWNLVFVQWKRAIQLLKDIPSKTTPVQQKLAEYQDGLEAATQAAKVSLNPSLAPVDEVGARSKGLIGVPAETPKAASPTPTTSPATPQATPQATPSSKPGKP